VLGLSIGSMVGVFMGVAQVGSGNSRIRYSEQKANNSVALPSSTVNCDRPLRGKALCGSASRCPIRLNVVLVDDFIEAVQQLAKDSN